MKRILMKTSYRDFYKPGDIVEEDDGKANELVRLGRAEFIDVEEKAPVNKEFQTSSKGNICSDCGKGFASERGLKLHQAKTHK